MIPGVIASQASDAAAASSDDVKLLDFVNEVYRYNGQIYSAAEVVDQPGRINDNTDDVGLSIREESTGAERVQLFNPFAAALLAGTWTVVIEFEAIALPSGTANYRYFLLNMEGLNSEMDIYTSSMFPTVYDEHFIAAISRLIDTGSAIAGDTVHKIAVTRTSTLLAFSIDGGAVVQNATTQAALDVDHAYIGGVSLPIALPDGAYGYIRSFQIYTTPKTAAELPALSTL